MPFTDGVVPEALQHELRDGGMTASQEKRALRAATYVLCRRDLLTQVLFLICFTVLTGRGLLDPHAFQFRQNIRRALVFKP